MSLSEEAVGRRRGAALETALMEAAWAELVEHGYGGFAMDGVAKRAATSRAVLYRRWDDKHALVLDALRWRRAQRPVETPDTGTVRGDILALLDHVEAMGDLARVLMVGMAAYVETGIPIAAFRRELIRDTGKAFTPVLERAIARGEIDPDRLTPMIKALPMDLIRHHVLMTGDVPSREVREEIVDTVFLPLVAVGMSGSTPTPH